MKPTQEQVIAWAREVWGDDSGKPWSEAALLHITQLAAIAYEAGRKDENEDCAKQVGQHWDAFEELKAAHYRNSPEPFDPFRFHRDLSTIFFSRDMAEAIRARRE